MRDNPEHAATSLKVDSVARNQFSTTPTRQQHNDPLAEAKACRDEFDKIESGLQTQTHEWLQKVFGVFLLLENNRKDHYLRFIKDSFFEDFSKKRPKLDDRPYRVLRNLLRYVFSASKTRGGRYNTAGFYSRRLNKLFEEGVKTNEVAARLNKKSTKFKLLDVAAGRKKKAAVEASQAQARSKPSMKKSKSSKAGSPKIKLEGKLLSKVATLPHGGAALLTLKRTNRGVFRVVDAQLFPRDD